MKADVTIKLPHRDQIATEQTFCRPERCHSSLEWRARKISPEMHGFSDASNRSGASLAAEQIAPTVDSRL